MSPHGRTYWVLVAAISVVGAVLLASVLTPLLRRGIGSTDRELAAARDSLVAARTDLARDRRIHAAKDAALVEANAAMDSLLRKPPKVVYVRIRGHEASPGLPRDTLSPDLGSGDTTVALVPLPAYNALASACSNAQSACDSAQAASRFVISDLERQHRADSTIVITTNQQLRRERRASAVAHVRDGGLGALVGAVLCAFFCR